MKNIFQASTGHTSEVNLMIGILVFATMTRIAIPPFIGLPPNFSAIDATALFCGAYFNRRLMACGMLLVSVWIGDVFLNKMLMGHWMLFYPGFYWQYGCYVLIICMGSLLKNQRKSIYLLPICLAASILFFVISNLGVWLSGLLYPMTLDGLLACYIAAIPFFKNTLLSDLFFSIVLFGIFELCRSPGHLKRTNKPIYNIHKKVF